jgi:dTDP-4-dehydrorhamnose 3,5-epimerase-like enzyme
MKQNLMAPKILELEKRTSATGKLTFFESSTDFPFQIKRSFWISSVPAGAKRGLHAHKKESQLLICLNGSVVVELEDLGKSTFHFELYSPDKALFLPPLVWSAVSFGKGAILLVLSDQKFREADYIRNKADFENLQLNYLKSR